MEKSRSNKDSQLRTFNPSTGETIKEYDLDVDVAVRAEAAHERYLTWRSTSYQERMHQVQGVASLLRQNKEKYARTISLEMGKPIAEAVAEIKKCAALCDYYGQNLIDLAEGRQIEWQSADAKRHHTQVILRPLGAILGIMPWNYPFWQVMRFAIPAICAGNVALLKHAEAVTGTALNIQDLFFEAGLPENVFQTILASHDQVEDLIQHNAVKGVSLTGSTNAGKHIARVAGEAMKPTLFELGGSDPYIVLADADIEHAAKTCVQHRMLNSGQSCIAAKRFIVEKSVADKFSEAVIAECEKLKVGDPMEEATTIGPMARGDLKEKLAHQLHASVDAGAKLIWDDKSAPSHANFFAPCVLRDPPVSCPAYHDELFGPVATIITAKDRNDACRIANDTSFGLGAAIFSEDVDEAWKLASYHIEAGMVAVNEGVVSDPRVPFGGIGDSGYGRECAEEGLRAFCNEKTVTRPI